MRAARIYREIREKLFFPGHAESARGKMRFPVPLPLPVAGPDGKLYRGCCFVSRIRNARLFTRSTVFTRRPERDAFRQRVAGLSTSRRGYLPRLPRPPECFRSGFQSRFNAGAYNFRYAANAARYALDHIFCGFVCKSANLNSLKSHSESRWRIRAHRFLLKSD